MRIFWLKIVVTTGLVAALILSHRLWLSTRFYPLTPVFPFLKTIPPPFDWALFFSLIAVAALIAAIPKPSKLILTLVALAAVLVLFDQSRLQPWFYQYIFMLLALRSRTPLNTCRLIIVCTYFWSGLQKLNANFPGEIFDWLAEPLNQFLPHALKPLISSFGAAVPFMETAIAIGFLFKKTRPAAVLLAIGMHVFILIGIGPWGHNSNTVVWPWNIVMIACLLILFWRTADVAPRDIVWTNRAAFQAVVLVLFGIAPLLNFFNLWDSYLSSALYTANKNRGTLILTDSAYDKLPESIQDYASDETNRHTIDIADWSFGELNVPPYPEIRIYKNVARAVCAWAPAPSGVKLVIKEKSALVDGGRTFEYDCRELSAASPPRIQ